MKFDDNGRNKLFDYVEELLFSFDKAFDNCSDATKIRYVKSNLPSSVSQILIHNNDFNDPTTLNQFMGSIRQYDKSRSTSSSDDHKAGNLKATELVSIVKELVKEIKQGDADKPKVAAMRFDSRENSPARERFISRPSSPRDQFRTQSSRDYNRHMHMNQEPSNHGYQPVYRGRSPSPRRQFIGNGPNYYRQDQSRYQPVRYSYEYQNQMYSRNNPTIRQDTYPEPRYRSPSPHRRQYDNSRMQQTSGQRYSSGYERNTDVASSRAFSDAFYYQKFGMPPTPCPRCRLMHWERHCIDNLN